MDTVYRHIQNHYDDLSSTEQLVIDYILNNGDFLNLKMKVIQKSLHISAPTIVRAIKKLSYRSFTDFKYALANSEKQESALNSEESYELLISTFSSDFSRTIAMMDKDKLYAIASVVLQSHRIFCMAMGSSVSVVNSLNRKLKQFGLWSNNYTEAAPFRDIADVATKDDCLLIFSLSGKEEQILASVVENKTNGVTIISVTGFSNNPLANLSDISLLTYQTPQKRTKLRSRLMLSVASEIIFETILLKNEEENK
ncbi:MurR/RpiR family transcriptional regulator [Tetragenococcus solitarius]|uniref:MurR/RpiR family transcriptional regulator n=1 Tax=Tetragenococcus solitarius TaxID=71453 RepID=A0ABP6KV89_9ENTE|nr:MurR/RpiR family transcriptional regulator [Tetragenococcus solitarius]